MKRIAAFFLAFALACSWARADDKSFVLATTTSTDNSGLLDAIIPLFTERTGITVKVVAIGTGQALAMGRRGDAAALLTHDRLGEDEFVAGGFGADRRDVMYNDFVIIGPANDPANVTETATTMEALSAIVAAEPPFVSRGDDSGTHRRERRLWADAGYDHETFDNWYREAGSGMGQTILTALQLNAYTLSDRATWVKFASKGEHKIVFESDPPLNNPYSSIIVTNDAIPVTETDNALQWHDWLTGPEGKRAIADFRVEGQQLFFVD